MRDREKNTGDRPRIKILIIEDDEGDAKLICRLLSNAENLYFDIERAGLMSSGDGLLAKNIFDVILSDLGLPDSAGVETLAKLHRRYPDIPMIVLTAFDDEATALSIVQSGAQDYLVKGQISTSQLIRSIRYAMERQKLVTELEKKIKEIKTLQGLLPICAWCKNIRDDKGYWTNLEAYIRKHSTATFTHGICPKCMKKVIPELYEEIRGEEPAIREQERKQNEQQPADEAG